MAVRDELRVLVLLPDQETVAVGSGVCVTVGVAAGLRVPVAVVSVRLAETVVLWEGVQVERDAVRLGVPLCVRRREAEAVPVQVRVLCERVAV